MTGGHKLVYQAPLFPDLRGRYGCLCGWRVPKRIRTKKGAENQFNRHLQATAEVRS